MPTVGHRAASKRRSACCRRSRRPAVGVVDADGRLVGLVTAETIGEMLMVREAMPDRHQFGPWARRMGGA